MVQEKHLINTLLFMVNIPDRFELWCGFDLTGYDKPGFGPAAIAELERCVRLGARGVGEITDKGSGLSRDDGPAMHIDDPRMDQILEKLADLELANQCTYRRSEMDVRANGRSQ